MTDILHSNSTMLYPGEAERRLVQRAFEPGESGADSAELPVVSRKQQVIPALARALIGGEGWAWISASVRQCVSIGVSHNGGEAIIYRRTR
ncbi:MAG: hypothetical protein U0841_12935 [Chloroflexia bacterium]